MFRLHEAVRRMSKTLPKGGGGRGVGRFLKQNAGQAVEEREEEVKARIDPFLSSLEGEGEGKS